MLLSFLAPEVFLLLDIPCTSIRTESLQCLPHIAAISRKMYCGRLLIYLLTLSDVCRRVIQCKPRKAAVLLKIKVMPRVFRDMLR